MEKQSSAMRSFLPIQAVPYLRAVRRLISGHAGNPQTISARTEVLCPEETKEVPAPIYLPGQLDRLTEYNGPERWTNATTQAEIASATATTVTYAPTVAYHIENAVLFDGSIYARHYRCPIAEQSLFNSTHDKPCHLKVAGLASSYLGTKFFAHWLADDCVLHLMAESVGSPLVVRGSGFSDEIKYQDYFAQVRTPTDRAWIDHLILYQDFSQNSYKRKRIEVLRDRIRARFPRNGQETYVYLRRGRTGSKRLVENEDEIIELLSKHGFTILDIGSDSLEHILGVLVNAKIAVSIEGSHTVHTVFAMPSKSALLVLQPSDRFSSLAHAMANAVDMRTGFVVGRRKTDGYRFPIDDVVRTIDLLIE
jgi:hypothetical protein